jgi:hypothetical protein
LSSAVKSVDYFNKDGRLADSGGLWAEWPELVQKLDLRMDRFTVFFMNLSFAYYVVS